MTRFGATLVITAVVVAGLAARPAAAHGTSDDGHVASSDFDRSQFPNRPISENRFLPLVPGTQFVYVGQATAGPAVRPHRVVTIVTDLTKVIDGVRVRVVLDRDFSDGQLVESELAFQAEDRRGTVWSLGEYPEEFEEGEFQGAPSTWLSGRQHARAGILMQAHPRLGTPVYSQGFAPRIDFADQGKVKAKGVTTCVPAGCFHDVLVVDESDALDPAGGHQLKYHAPGVGVVRIEPVGDRDQETLVLVRVERLSAKQLAEADEKAIRLDQRAYRFAKPIYRDTPPVRIQPGD